MIIRSRAYPRAALIGNPSDGYHGKTIAFVFSNFHADVELYESPELELLPARRDGSVFQNLDALAADVAQFGYYGGIRLLKAGLKKFWEYSQEQGWKLPERNFTIRYSSNIPNRLGMAGSSAIITAALRAVLRFYRKNIEPAYLANLVLAVEREELGIPAGLQDRVAQAFNYPVYMDFNAEFMERNGAGRYELLEIPDDLKLFVAYRTDLAEGSEILHSRLRDDYNDGVKAVRDAMLEWAFLTEQVREAIAEHHYERLPALINRNFDLRCEVCAGSISAKNRQMVELARKNGASAKFTGSGGAIIGTYEDEAMFLRMKQDFAENSIGVIKPRIVRLGKRG
ncbi:MAG: GHMP kinase [Lentisphaeria bacterium]|nr:GHMP kinase [Lentisphaeria bacterium]